MSATPESLLLTRSDLAPDYSLNVATVGGFESFKSLGLTPIFGNEMVEVLATVAAAQSRLLEVLTIGGTGTEVKLTPPRTYGDASEGIGLVRSNAQGGIQVDAILYWQDRNVFVTIGLNYPGTSDTPDSAAPLVDLVASKVYPLANKVEAKIAAAPGT